MLRNNNDYNDESHPETAKLYQFILDNDMLPAIQQLAEKFDNGTVESTYINYIMAQYLHMEYSPMDDNLIEQFKIPIELLTSTLRQLNNGTP